MTRYIVVAAIVLVVLWGRSAFYAVDQAEYVYVTRFGEPVVIRDGASDAGLHLKAPWPIESVQRIDRRVQSFDLPAVESLTRDPVTGTVDKTLAVDASITWKVPNTTAADRFFRTIRTPEQA
jgi:membrane protease subunit HflC